MNKNVQPDNEKSLGKKKRECYVEWIRELGGSGGIEGEEREIKIANSCSFFLRTNAH